MDIQIKDYEEHDVSIDIIKSDASYSERGDKKLTVFQIYRGDEYLDHLIVTVDQLEEFRERLSDYIDWIKGE